MLAAEKPDVVFTHWPIDRHRDHRAISMLTLDAWWKGGKRFALYYYEVAEDTTMFSPAEYVNITAVEGRRRAACYAHVSQQPGQVVSQAGGDHAGAWCGKRLFAGGRIPETSGEQAGDAAVRLFRGE